MKHNKKTQINKLMNIAGVVLVFGVIIFLYLFTTVGFKQIFSENILSPTISNLTSSVNDSGLTIAATTLNQISNIESEFDEPFFDYDLFFLIMFFITFTGTMVSAAKVDLDNVYSFFGFITFGTMIFLLILTFINQVRDWLILNFYTNLFDLTFISTPIIDWFLSNSGLLSFIWFILIVLVASLNWKGIVKDFNASGRFEE